MGGGVMSSMGRVVAVLSMHRLALLMQVVDVGGCQVVAALSWHWGG